MLSTSLTLRLSRTRPTTLHRYKTAGLITPAVVGRLGRGCPDRYSAAGPCSTSGRRKCFRPSGTGRASCSATSGPTTPKHNPPGRHRAVWGRDASQSERRASEMNKLDIVPLFVSSFG
jgi:hypothetical protein